MREIQTTLLVIGAGPGGYVCAIRAGQLGVDTVIVEAAALGGTCLNVGCIPSKAIIHVADEFHRSKRLASGSSATGLALSNPTIDFNKTVSWKNDIVSRLNHGVSGLLKKAGVKSIQGIARFKDGKTIEVQTETGPQLIRAQHIVIATGSDPIELTSLPFGDKVVSSTEALEFAEIPSKLVVVGGGYIGLELGTAYAKLGSEVTIVEAADRLLPQYDAELTRPVTARLKELEIESITHAMARGLSARGDALVIETVSGDERRLQADQILVTVGRKARLDGWGREEIELNLAGNFIQVDDQCRTSMRGIYAIGDVTGEPMLAHRAMAQGEMVAEIISGAKRAWDKVCVPAVCFTDPEIVTAGLSPDEARNQVGEIRVGTFPLRANGRAMTLEQETGFIRVVARADNHLVLGLQAVGASVSELSASFALSLEMGARLEDLAATIHAHPTLSEGIPEAAMLGLGHALHI